MAYKGIIQRKCYRRIYQSTSGKAWHEFLSDGRSRWRL